MAIKAKYTEQVVIMVTPEVREWLQKAAESREISVSRVVRELIDYGKSEGVSGFEVSDVHI